MRKLRKLGGVAVLTLAFGVHCFGGIIGTPPEPPPAPEPSGIIGTPPDPSAPGIISTPPEAPGQQGSLAVSVMLALVQIIVP